MKKVVQLMLLVGIMNGIVRGSEIKEKDISFGPKLKYTMHRGGHETRYAPSTPYAHIKESQSARIRQRESIPEGYVRVGTTHYFQKKLPISTQHEKYNMFIEGYEPKEEFEKRIVAGGPHSDWIKNRSRWAQRKELLKNPEYQEQQAQERDRLLEVERQSRTKQSTMSDPEFWNRVEKRIKERNRQAREQSYWYRFTNWLSSFRSTPTTSQPIYHSEYATTESNPYLETPVYE